MAIYFTKLENLANGLKVHDEALSIKILATVPFEYIHVHSAWDLTSKIKKLWWIQQQDYS